VIRLKVITEVILRSELRASEPEVYYVEKGCLLSPAAREYLQQRKIKVANACNEEPTKTVRSESGITVEKPEPTSVPSAKFIDYETDAYYTEKPEHMTHLYGNVLVPKNHPRIVFRGKLDSLQALIVLDQTILAEKEENQKVINDLSEILGILRTMMRCDVMNEELKVDTILGLTHAELRERSHDPMKFYKVKQMVLPEYTLGKTYALLNQLRAAIRETEVAASEAFRAGTKCTKMDIIEELNRLSSCLHIMMCMYLAGQYH
jgi:ethanolamine utilization cobalamin adenosyltransferase